MSVTVNLRPEVEQRLREKAALSGKNVEELLGWIAENWIGTNGSSSAPVEAPSPKLDQWLADWRAWAASHATRSADADDSRESIYAGRGE